MISTTPSTWSFRGFRGAVAMAVVGSALALGSCFNPNIGPNLRCADAPNKECPDGYMCAGVNRICVKIGTAASGGAGTGGMGTGGMGTGGAGTGGARLRQKDETCTPVTGVAQGNCDNGLLCMNDCAGARCYKPCAGDGDCSDSYCMPSLGGVQRYCDRALKACNPADMNLWSNLPCGNVQTCRVVTMAPSLSTDGTVCDCAVGDGARGSPCTESRDCVTGNICPPNGSMGGGFCFRACDPTAAAGTMSACIGTQTCVPISSNGKWGFCFP